MPVPTETMRSMRKLNLVFAAASVFFLLITGWLIWDDYDKAWRVYQRDAQTWQAAILEDTIDLRITDDLKRELAVKEDEIRQLRNRQPHDKIAQLRADWQKVENDRIKADLPLARAKAEVVPTEQKIERARLQYGEDDARTQDLRKYLDTVKSDVRDKEKAMAGIVAELKKIEEQIAANVKLADEQKKELESLAREKQALEAKLARLDPHGPALIGQKARNAPLIDWFNPSEKIEQDIIPGVRTDLNFLSVETTDACRTCHLHIDRPEFQEHELVRFLQRQIAQGENQETRDIDDAAVAIGFWENALAKLEANGLDASLRGKALKVQQATLKRIAGLRDEAGMKALALAAAVLDKDAAAVTAEEAASLRAALGEELQRIAGTKGDAKVSRRKWYEQRLLYVEDLQSLAREQIGAEQFKHLKSLFRTHLIEAFNGLRKEAGHAKVSPNPVLLAHPRLDLYVDPESSHPIAKMGCSVCHEGSGQDTSFYHTAHVPQKVWVDAETGAKVPDFLLTGKRGNEGELKKQIRDADEAKAKLAIGSGAIGSGAIGSPLPQSAGGEGRVRGPVDQGHSSRNSETRPPHPSPLPRKAGGEGAGGTAGALGLTTLAAKAEAPHGDAKKDGHEHAGHGTAGHAHGHADLSQQDVNLLSPKDPAPFAPAAEDHDPAALYADPSAAGATRVAVRQETYWKKRYNWKPVPNHDWEKPMHAMEYVQSSCTKCHTGHYDLREEGPKVFEGRKLFAQLGCANCHLVDAIAEHKDVKKAGPSLVNIKHKLSPSMMASWIWAPKSFRPTSRMPHFWMLENNSAPIDILRSRTEVAALTQYLLTAEPSANMKVAELMAEGARLSAEHAKKETSASRKEEIAGRRYAIDQEIARIRAEGLVAYKPELPPTVGKLKTLADEKAGIDAKLKDAATKAEDKPALEKRLAEIAGEERAAKEKPMVGDAKRGRDLFFGLNDFKNPDLMKDAGVAGVGCLACHTNLNETGKQWITGDLMARTGLTAAQADKAFGELSYNQQHTYVLQYLGGKLNRKGPELSGIGTKLKAGRGADDARAWLYDWLRNPRHFSATTIMPSFRLTEQEALDITEYLLQQERPGIVPDAGGTPAPYEAVDFLAEMKNPLNQEMLGALARRLGVDEQARKDAAKVAAKRGSAEVESQDLVAARLPLVGKKMVTHYNCQACHLVNGFETTASTAPQLNEWGLKDPHKLDFGYYEHAEDSRREHPASVWKADHEGLGEAATRITADSVHAKAHGQKLSFREVAWEHIEGDRRSWAIQKLHNTRIYDRGRYVIPADVAALERPEVKKIAAAKDDKSDAELKKLRSQVAETLGQGIDKAYDKLKMPKFFMTDREAQAIVTFVTSVRKPLVEPALQKVADSVGEKATVGRQIAEKYNCYGCHNIDGNEVAIHAYFGVLNDHGQFNGDFERIMNTPPRLIGQGAKTQPDWIVYFLGNVHGLRPWLKMRMPSFDYEDNDAVGVADYFAGSTYNDGNKVRKLLQPIDDQIDKNRKRRFDLAAEKARIAERKARDEAEKDASKKLTADAIRSMDVRTTQIDAQLATIDQWHTSPALGRALDRLKAFAVRNQLVLPRRFDARENGPADRAKAWEESLSGAQFLAKVYRVQYPFPRPQLPDISDERFARGEMLLTAAPPLGLGCVKCHPLGNEVALFDIWKKDNPGASQPKPPTKPDDDDFFGDEKKDEKKPDAKKPDEKKPDAKKADDDDPFGVGEEKPAAPAPPTGPGYSAPNLKYAVNRLQPTWVDLWLQRSTTILPGTKMPPQWPGPLPSDSFAFAFPDEIKNSVHAQFYHTGPEQRALIMDFLYAAGMRNHTPGLWKLTAGATEPKVTLPPIPAPRPDEFKLPEIAGTGPGVEVGPKVTAGPTVEKAKSDIVLHDGAQPFAGDAVQGNKTRVVGVVKFTSAAPRRKNIDMGSDPVCDKAHPDGQLEEAMIVNKDGTMRYAFVHVKNVSGKFEAPKDTALLDQVGCMYKPHVIGVMVGQPFAVRNSDPTLHNVNIQSATLNANFGQPVKGMVNALAATKPDMNVNFKCDVHKWMNARVYVLPHPFFAVSDVEGRFEIKGLPPGKYTLEVLHESSKVAPVTIDVEVKADTSVRADVELK